MAKVVLLVHSPVCQLALMSQLARNGFMVHSPPLPAIEKSSGEQMNELTLSAVGFLEQHRDADAIIVESNYGYPSFEGFNGKLLNYINDNFDNKERRTKIIAYSGTESSLQAVLKAEEFKKILVMSKTLTKKKFLKKLRQAKLTQDHNRLIDRKEVIDFLKAFLDEQSSPNRIQRSASIQIGSSAPFCDDFVGKSFSVEKIPSPLRYYTPSRDVKVGAKSNCLVEEATEKMEKMALC